MTAMAQLERICRALPKTDLHVHLDGSVRPATLVDLAASAKATTPAVRPIDRATAERRMRVGSESRSLPDYLSKFAFTNGYLQTPEALARVTRELVEDAAAENVRILEIRFCPLLHTAGGAPASEILEAVLISFREAAESRGVRGGILVDALREHPSDKCQQMAELAVQYKERGVLAFDLAGNEAEHDATSAASAFEIVGAAGLRRIAHAGEAAGPESIRQAVDVLRAERIGHGTKLLGDAKLLAEIAERGIPLEVCLTSNIQTRAVSDLSTHPFCRYLRAGVRVTINTDNRTVSNTTSTRELAFAWYYGGLTREELKRLLLHGVDASFLSPDEKASLREEFAAQFEEVLSREGVQARA